MSDHKHTHVRLSNKPCVDCDRIRTQVAMAMAAHPAGRALERTPGAPESVDGHLEYLERGIDEQRLWSDLEDAQAAARGSSSLEARREIRRARRRIVHWVLTHAHEVLPVTPEEPRQGQP